MFTYKGRKQRPRLFHLERIDDKKDGNSPKFSKNVDGKALCPPPPETGYSGYRLAADFDETGVDLVDTVSIRARAQTVGR